MSFGVFSDIIRDEANMKGYFLTNRIFQEKFFCDIGQISPRVEFQVIKNRSLGEKLTAIFSIDIKDFENEWVCFLEKVGFSHFNGDQPPMGIHSSNMLDLSSCPYLRGSSSKDCVEDARSWINSVFCRAKKFPNTEEKLIKSLKNNSIIGFELWRCWGHPIKVNAFLEWMEKYHNFTGISKLLPISHSRSFPYEDIRTEGWCN